MDWKSILRLLLAMIVPSFHLDPFPTDFSYQIANITKWCFQISTRAGYRVGFRAPSLFAKNIAQGLTSCLLWRLKHHVIITHLTSCIAFKL